VEHRVTRGTLITTEECLLDYKINTKSKIIGEEIEQALAIIWREEFLWLGKGIPGSNSRDI